MRTILSFAFTFFVMNCMGQAKGTAVLKAYHQPVVSGVNNGVIEEGGTEAKMSDERKGNDYIYLLSASRVYPVELWLDGKRYGVIAESVSSPVRNPHYGAGSKDPQFFVPANTNKVVRLSASPAIEGKEILTQNAITESNEILVVYRSAGKLYYSVLKKATLLDGAAME